MAPGRVSPKSQWSCFFCTSGPGCPGIRVFLTEKPRVTPSLWVVSQLVQRARLSPRFPLNSPPLRGVELFTPAAAPSLSGEPAASVPPVFSSPGRRWCLPRTQTAAGTTQFSRVQQRVRSGKVRAAAALDMSSGNFRSICTWEKPNESCSRDLRPLINVRVLCVMGTAVRIH